MGGGARRGGRYIWPVSSDPPKSADGPVPIVVLVSGSGSILAALIEACAQPDYGVTIVAVGADRHGIRGLDRASEAGIATFVVATDDFPTRSQWDEALADTLGQHLPDRATQPWVVSVGFMKIVGPTVLGRFRVLNSHPALLPAFPGAHAVDDALTHGVKVTGSTIHLVDAGVDTGPIVAQRAVPVRADDDAHTLHERIKVVERDLMVRTVQQITTGRYSLTDRKVTLA
ncbi:phosphoribosylglycinamide formyltransferase [soil metagenome]